MEIKGKCKYDYETCKAMSLVYSYKRNKPLKAVITHIIIAVVLALLNFYVIQTTGGETGNILIFALCIFIVVLELTVYFIMPRVQYNSMSGMKDMENEYVFRDSDFIAKTDAEEYKGNSVIKYTLLERVMETERYFFIFENKRQAFIVDKGTVEDGNADEIRKKLQSVLGKKYIICKY